MIACHVEGDEYTANKGSDSPPRKKFYDREEAVRIAEQMSVNYRKVFYVMESVEVTGEYTLDAYKEDKKELDDFWS
jgi:hypothetical protein